MTKTDRVREVAELVRKSFEEIGRNNTLGGYCGRAATQLWLECMKRGIEGVKIVEGAGHAFCMFTEANGYVFIADVTATQFHDSYPPIFITDFATAKRHLPTTGYHDFITMWNSAEEAFGAGSNLYGARMLWQEDRKIVEKNNSHAGLDEDMLELGIYMPVEN